MGADSLIERCINRERSAWAELVQSHRPVVLRVLAKALIAVDPQAASDLEQELYVRLLANDCEALRGLRNCDGAAVRAFLCRSALNLALDQRRRAGVRKAVVSCDLDALPVEPTDPGSDTELQYLLQERRAAVVRALEKVAKGPQADRDKLIFRAFYLDGLTATEVAAMGLGLSKKGVETVLLRLTAKVRRLVRTGSEDAA